MKLAITTENKLGITDDVLFLLKGHQVDLIKVEVEAGKIYLHTQDLENITQDLIASQLMQISGIKLVNQIEVLPGVEAQNMLASLMQVMPDPVVGVSNKGEITYTNRKARILFKPYTKNQKALDHMKHLFVASDWQDKVNAATSSNIPVNVKTVAGDMLLEVQGIQNQSGQINGAMLLFRGLNKIRASSYVVQGNEIDGLENMVYQSEAFKTVMRKTKTLAQVNAPLSIVGETGTGKTLLAHACHSMSHQSHALFTVIDCQSMKGDEMETALFGSQNRSGVFELNQVGTLFFSHIEYMSIYTQKKVLRKVQDDQCKIRVVSSSAQKLTQHQLAGKIISDLALALDILNLEVQPLRERVEDIEPLANHFLEQFNSQLGKELSISVDAKVKMNRYYWPGNVSQLKHVIYKSMMIAQDDLIQASDLDLEGPLTLETDLEGLTLNEAVSEFEKHFLQHWYQKYPSTRKLARQLGVSHTSIALKIKKYKLKIN